MLVLIPITIVVLSSFILGGVVGYHFAREESRQRRL